MAPRRRRVAAAAVARRAGSGRRGQRPRARPPRRDRGASRSPADATGGAPARSRRAPAAADIADQETQTGDRDQRRRPRGSRRSRPSVVGGEAVPGRSRRARAVVRGAKVVGRGERRVVRRRWAARRSVVGAVYAGGRGDAARGATGRRPRCRCPVVAELAVPVPSVSRCAVPVPVAAPVGVGARGDRAPPAVPSAGRAQSSVSMIGASLTTGTVVVGPLVASGGGALLGLARHVLEDGLDDRAGDLGAEAGLLEHDHGDVLRVVGRDRRRRRASCRPCRGPRPCPSCP